MPDIEHNLNENMIMNIFSSILFLLTRMKNIQLNKLS